MSIPPEPYQNFRHWAGPLVGLVAAVVGLLLNIFIPNAGLFIGTMGIAGLGNVLILSLWVEMPPTGRALLAFGGFVLGLVSSIAITLVTMDASLKFGLSAEVGKPVAAVGSGLLLGVGPLAIVMALPKVSAARWFLRMVACTFGVGLAAVFGIIIYGFFFILIEAIPKWIPFIFTAAGIGYLLFHCQVLCLFDQLGMAPAEPETEAPDSTKEFDLPNPNRDH